VYQTNANDEHEPMMTMPSCTVLLVDDNPGDRALFRHYLESIPEITWTIWEEERGEAGLAKCREVQPECIVLDYQLPDVNGLEFLDRLRREQGPEVSSVIVATGTDSEALAVEALKRGAQDYLVKNSITPEGLWRSILNALEKRELARTITAQQQTLVEKNLGLKRMLVALRYARDELELRVQERTGELLQTTDALRHNEHQLRVVLDNVPALVGYVGPDLRYRFGNRHYTEWFGIPSARLPGMHIRDVLGAAMWPNMQSHIDACLTGMEVSFEHETPLEGGATRWELVHVVPDRHEQPTDGFFILVTDITERKRLEAQTRERERLQTIGATAGNLTHEIGNRLNGISTTIQMLEHALVPHQVLSDVLVTETLSDLKAETQHLQAVLQDLYILTDVGQLDLQPLDITALTLEILHLQEPHLLRRRIHVEHCAQSALPLVHADRHKLFQVLCSLCANAAEAMLNGGTLTIREQLEGNHISVCVQDTGVGIADGAPVFEPFMTTKPGGSGLGLTLVKQIITAHGGTVTYVSTPGRGTTFTVTLPLASAAV
jgi:PAS domain S-box-containing protein